MKTASSTRRILFDIHMTQETLITFARHGESTANISRTISNRAADYEPLTDCGREQAKELLGLLRARGNITAIYTSPLTRALETARIIGDGCRLSVSTADALREPHCGEIEGRGDPEAWELHARQEWEWRSGNCDHRIPGGESLRDVEERFRPFIEMVVGKHGDTGGNILMVSHGSVLVNMLPRILLNIDEEFSRENGFGYCTIVTAVVTDKGLRCVEWGGKRFS
jgi:broad specificity phosphatase PhoE